MNCSELATGKMYRNNRIYGNNKALNQYSELEPDNPIWGEIQHSLEFKFELLKGIDSPRLVRAFLTWRKEDAKLANSYFGNKWKFLSIGDPFLYQCQSDSLPSTLATKSRILIVPRYQREESQDNRLNRHYELAKRFRSRSNSDIEVSLHPGEQNDKEVRGIYDSANILIRQPIFFFDVDYLEKEVRYLSSVAEIHSNYVGPTLLRAIYLGAKGFLDENSRQSKISVITSKIFRKQSTTEAEFEFASKLLGVESIRTKGELGSILTGNINSKITAQLRKIKFLSEMNVPGRLISRKRENIKVLCTKCISLSFIRVRNKLYFCNSCGFVPRKTDDYFCMCCNTYGKIGELSDHLASLPVH